jgi:hypothetical protein
MLLPKIGETIIVEFEGERAPCYVQAVGLYEEPEAFEYIEVLVNPGEGDLEFYAELFLEDMGHSWFIV